MAFLERIAQRELHNTSRFGFIQWSLRGGEAAEVRIRIAAEEGIGSQTQIRDRVAVKPLRVGDVENFPTELQRLTFADFPRLVQAHVERDVTRRAQHVAIADFTRTRWTEAAIRRERIAEDVWRAVRIRRRR